MAIQKFTLGALADGSVDNDAVLNNSIDIGKLGNVNLSIAPEVLEIQVDAPAAGQDTAWLWTWEQSTLPYARRTITNSPEVQVPLYKQGTYTVNNFAAYDTHDSMTQTHSLYLKWIDGAGTDNLISWATSAGPISDTHPDINGGAATNVQRITVNVPSTITLPTLTAPSVSYSVTNNGSGAYTFSGSAAGDNPNLGPLYKGGTYTFNVSATGHPFYLTTDNGTNFSAGTYFGEYTSGVTGSRTDSGTVTFTVPSDAPDTLYYQCGNHGSMRGALTIKDLAVETNINGNYVVYFQHTQEGHKTPVELRPIPSLVNQMCIVYDATSNTFVPQDLATYVENTPSFENKIREVAGTAELVVEDGSAVVAKVNVYDDSTYLPLTGNNPGDQAFATDTDILYIWDGSAWQQAGAANSDDLTEGTTNLFYTDTRVGTYLSSNGYDTATNIIASITDSAPATLDTLNELAAALGDDPNFATTTANNIALKAPINNPNFTGNITVGSGATARGSYSDILIAPGGDNAQIEFWGANTSFGISHFDNDRLGIYSNVSGSWDETRGINIKSDGKVGIGTTIPGSKLTVVNNSVNYAQIGTSYSGHYFESQSDDNTDGFEIYQQHGSNTTRNSFIVNDNRTGSKSAAFVVRGDGNIGIGETNPSEILVVKDTASTGTTIELKNNDNSAWVNNWLANGNRSDRMELNATQTTGNHLWLAANKVVLGSSTGDGNEVLETGPDVTRAHKPIASWTDSGTKYYTHLCTLSTYQATGAIIINTNIPGHNQSGNANMFSFRVTGYWYNSSVGGAIDMVVGCYAGENNYYNTTLTGTYPNAWKGKTWFATNSNGKVCLILGDTSTNQQCEIAVTDFVQGFINANTSYARDWSAQLVTSYSVTQQTTIYTRNPGGTQIINGTTRNKLYRSGTGTFTVSNTGVFTPIGTLSHFKIDIHVNVGVSDDEGGGNMNPYANGFIERSINGGAWTTADNTGISDQGGVSCHVEMSPPRVGTASNGDTYMWHQDRYRTKNHSSTFIDQPPLNMGDTLQYRLRCNLTSGNHIQFGEPVGYSTDDNYMAQPFGFIVQEFTPWS